jgi:hypothetical protein
MAADHDQRLILLTSDQAVAAAAIKAWDRVQTDH